ncbi:MAG: alpha/beta hydrolase family protein [Stellaceae bacterium]
MTSQRYLSGGLLIWLWLVTTLLPSLPANAATFATQDVMIPFAQKDGNVLQLDTMVLIPEGHRRFPLAVVSHGSPRHAYQRAYMRPTYFADMGQWLVNLGFVVAIPMRRGYGKSQGAFAEGFGSCAYPDYADAGRASAKDIEAVVTYMDHQTYVDANRIVLIGHSAGGWGSLALASEGPPGLVAAVLFAPGRGSVWPGEVCGRNALVTAAGLFGKTTHVPTLWIYSENDHYFSPKLARSIYDAFHATTHGPADFIEEPSCSDEGHMLVRRCPDVWHASVAAFLQKTVGRD